MNFIKTIEYLGQDTSTINRRIRLQSLIHRDCRVETNNVASNIILPATRQHRITLMAHYDLYPNSKGYNDNGSGLATLLSLQDIYPEFVEIAFTDKEEVGGLGSDFYMKNHNPEFVINVDVSGAGECVQFSKYPVNNDFKYDFLSNEVETIERFHIPFSDNHIIQNHGVPSMLVFAGDRGNESQTISKIWSLQHCNENDNKIELLSEDILQQVSLYIKKIIENYLK